MKWLKGGLGQFWFKMWLDRNASRVLSEAGIRKGQVVLDFGCGSGTYTIPAAKLVGEKGTVYGLDISRKALGKMQRKAEREGLRNIVRIDSSGGDKIPLEDETIDVMTLIDVLQEIDDKGALFDEAHRILKPGGIVIVYPMHIKKEEVERSGIARGLDLREEKYEGRILLLREIDRSGRSRRERGGNDYSARHSHRGRCRVGLESRLDGQRSDHCGRQPGKTQTGKWPHKRYGGGDYISKQQNR